MTQESAFAPGQFCWVELATPNSDKSKAFYTKLLGWKYNEFSMGEIGTYLIGTLGEGKDTCGMYDLSEDMKKMGIPGHWLSYVKVESADDTAAKARSLGGKVMKEPFDVMDKGRMSVITDPTGGAFALWQPKQAGGAPNADPGFFCWNELLTNNLDQAGKFYSDLFGWSPQVHGEMNYTMLMNRGRPIGGMLPIKKEWGKMPANWLVYFSVKDCDQAVKLTEGEGGKVLMPSTDFPSVGRAAVLHDPLGVAFGVIKLDQQPK